MPKAPGPCKRLAAILGHEMTFFFKVDEFLWVSVFTGISFPSFHSLLVVSHQRMWGNMFLGYFPNFLTSGHTYTTGHHCHDGNLYDMLPSSETNKGSIWGIPCKKQTHKNFVPIWGLTWVNRITGKCNTIKLRACPRLKGFWKLLHAMLGRDKGVTVLLFGWHDWLQAEEQATRMRAAAT